MGGVVSGIVGGGGGGTTVIRESAPSILSTDKAPTVSKANVGAAGPEGAAGSKDSAKALLLKAKKSKTRLSGNVGEAKLLKPTLLGE